MIETYKFKITPNDVQVKACVLLPYCDDCHIGDIYKWMTEEILEKYRGAGNIDFRIGRDPRYCKDSIGVACHFDYFEDLKNIQHKEMYEKGLEIWK